MLPNKCSECKGQTKYSFIVKKDAKIKTGICLLCKKKLELRGWAAYGDGIRRSPVIL